MSTTARRRPFEGEPRAVVVLPEADPTFGGNAALLELEKAELEAELGTAVELSTSDPGEGARWLLVLDAERAGPATVEYEPEAKLIVSRAVDVGGLLESMNLWRIVARSGGGSASATDCEGLEQAIERVTVEVADTYPAFGLRGLDWDAICARHVERVRATDNPLAALQSWLAELQDGHTWVWPAFGNLSYALRLDDEAATFVRVRAGSAGEEAESDEAGRLPRSTVRPSTSRGGSTGRLRRHIRDLSSPAAACSPGPSGSRAR